MASKGRPYRTVNILGWEVLVGRGDEDNDHLTFDVAEPHDLWLHVAGGTPGSHVVVQNPGKGEVPRAVVERAAELAAWYSKARGAPRVEVHVCRASDVTKPRGAPKGLVQLARFRSLKVKPVSAADDASAADGTSPAPPERGRNQGPRRGQRHGEGSDGSEEG